MQGLTRKVGLTFNKRVFGAKPVSKFTISAEPCEGAQRNDPRKWKLAASAWLASSDAGTSWNSGPMRSVLDEPFSLAN